MSLFSKFYIKSFHIYKFTQVRCSLCTENNIILTTAFEVSETLTRCAKELHFLNYCSPKMNKFLIQNIHLTSDIHDFFIYPLSIFSYQLAVKKLDVYLSWAKYSSIYFSDVDLSWAKFR